MKQENKALLIFLGAISVLGSVVAFMVSPPAITMYRNNGFFWWGFVPGLFFAAGIMAIIIARTE